MTINQIEHNKLLYFDDCFNETHPNYFLGEDKFLVRVFLKTGEENMQTHVGWVEELESEISEEKLLQTLDAVWSMLTDIPTDSMTPDDDKFILEDFYIWRAGTYVLDIWAWFDKRYPEGLGKRHL